MRSDSIRLRRGLRHPLTWMWAAALAVSLAWWWSAPERAELPLWEHFAFHAAVLGTFLWNEVSVGLADAFLKKHPEALFALFSAAAFLQTEISISDPLTSISFWGVVWSLLTALSVYVLLYAVIGRVWLAGAIGSAALTVLSLVNYYTLSFRGTPVCPADLFSAGTAADVLGAYRLTFTPDVAAILALLVLQLTASFPALRARKRPLGKKMLAVRLALLILPFVWYWLSCFTSVPYQIGLELSEWSWSENYYSKGYLCTTLLRVKNLFFTVPDGYSDEEAARMLAEMDLGADGGEGSTPNVIVIVNESWFDWTAVTDFTTDKPVTPFLDELDNCIKGYAVNPIVGTAASEYEVLTSNSMCLFPSNNPFTQMDLTGSSSLARYLGALGYESFAFHPCPETNYNRNVAYPALGFDHSYFIDSPEIAAVEPVNVHIGYSDQSCFDVLTMLYERHSADGPLLLYNLTFQNHGGYLISDVNGGWSKTDPDRIIHVTSGFENVRAEAEEYLTALSYTDEAFRSLVEYFEAVDDPTVICMVGDHQSYFSETTPDGHKGFESTMVQRGTPFVIWANFPIEGEDAGYIGMPQLVPLMLETAGVELSPYYQSILELSDEIPLLASAFYRTADGEFHEYSLDDLDGESDLLRRYLYFEYNNFAYDTEKLPQLLLPLGAAG